jgi:AcrR family transcriptional regulator
MASLARDLGVARATLYRWTGDREQLLGDVAWLEVKLIVDHLVTTTPGAGASYIEQAGGDLLTILADNPILRGFLDAEGDDGMRLLTAPRGRLRPRLVAAVTDAIDAQVESGAYDPPAETRLLADGIVALGERFLYHGGDPAMNPDPSTARLMIALLLREPCADSKGGAR